MNLSSPADVASLLKKHNFRPAKGLGQNFLTDRNIIEKIIDGANINAGDLVLEIGPGVGALTAAAAKRAGKVIGVEIDEKLLPILDETLGGFDNIKIIKGDILKESISDLISRNIGTGGGVKIIGNLPYYITSPVIMKILEEKTTAESLTVMVQKEVAGRIKAGSGSKAYGAITAAINYYCEVRHITDVPRDVFLPKPNVDSAVIRLDIRKIPPVALKDEKTFFMCIKAGFGQRRKTLLNALTGLYGMDKKSAEAALYNASIDPMRRAETLDIREFAALANRVYEEAGNKR